MDDMIFISLQFKFGVNDYWNANKFCYKVSAAEGSRSEDMIVQTASELGKVAADSL